MTALRFLPLLLYVATIFGANWAIATYGPVPVGFGLMAPAGFYFAGLAFTLRDVTQEALGRWWVLVAIALGAAASVLVSSPQLALASAVAFLVSELADFAVYTPLRSRNWLLAVFASNVVGLVFDSALFLWLAFGSFDFLAGQIVGKVWMTLLAVALLAVWRQRASLPGLRQQAG
jgi:uncharacterized PurR-regulated membrane protein YhhQ (DUF165 family)